MKRMAGLCGTESPLPLVAYGAHFPRLQRLTRA